MVSSRNIVIWFGVPPNEETKNEYENRGLNLLIHGDSSTLPDLQQVKAAIFNFEKMNSTDLANDISKNAAQLVNNNIWIGIVTPNEKTIGDIQKAFKGSEDVFSRWLKRDPPSLLFKINPSPHLMAEHAARFDSGADARKDLEIVVANNRLDLRSGDDILFRRAFAHCKKIVLVDLTNGRSDARVFAVHMTVDTSQAGIWPQPFFAKVDTHEKIEREFRNYKEFAEQFIPFGLRPNVQKLVTGTERSLLAGNFVDRSESLWDLVRRNVAAQAISALIEETLLGWRNQAYAEAEKLGSVATAMANAGLCEPDKIKPRYVEYAAQRGIDLSVNEIWQDATSISGQKFRLAPIHGDLHGENVRVRNGQAILIDLASVQRQGPLTADLAALETWLAFELPPQPEEDPNAFKNERWRLEIDRLYAADTFRHPPGPCEATSHYYWMATAVRQIRHMGIAAQSCATEYQTAVAVQLLRRCQWDDGCNADLFRRGHGFVLAAALIKDLKSKVDS